jgi:hypothetical protein
MPANSEDKSKPGRTPDNKGDDQQAEARHDEQAHAPQKNLQHGGDFSRGNVERNRNQGGYDGKR